ncbi:MAG TPA: NAD(P)/FAD-dependent oxidoreductase [Acidimicrobiales bacterium]|nr:NAD(P)/FAD-dependent oxidoreductase [Acidimicrobiales bacterium]
MEHLDVAVVGAGLSGVGAGHYLEEKCPWASYAVFEARDSIGGTWDLFRYPGIRSDSDMYTLGYQFRPWDSDRAIADGASILAYIKETASESGVDRRIRYHHRVVRADWSSAQARWHVTAERTDTGETAEFTCGFLFACTGYYRYDHGYVPDFCDLHRFEGTLVHPQAWPQDLDVTGKRVVVVGSGATAVTLVPALAERAQHVTMLQRSPTYIAAVPAVSPVPRLLRKLLPRRLAADVTRWVHALFAQGFYQVSQRHPSLVRRILRAGLKRQLPRGYDIDTHFRPSYKPWDQRFCIAPDGDLFVAIREGRASVVTDHVERFVPHGIVLQSGYVLDADVVVTATGFELQFFGGGQLSVDGQDVKLPSKMTYKGLMLQDVPNFAFAVGYVNASWTLKCDLTCQYVCRLLNHMHDSGLRQCTAVYGGDAGDSAPLLALTSGYVDRSAHILPKQGPAFPWKVYQSYLRDYLAMRRRPVTDEAMVFSNPAPGAVGGAESGAEAPVVEAGPVAAGVGG